MFALHRESEEAMTGPGEALQRLQTDAERWVAAVTTDGALSGKAAHEIRKIIDAANLLGSALSATPANARAVALEEAAQIAHTYRGVGDAAAPIEDAIRALAATLPKAPQPATARSDPWDLDKARRAWHRKRGADGSSCPTVAMCEA